METPHAPSHCSTSKIDRWRRWLRVIHIHAFFASDVYPGCPLKDPYTTHKEKTRLQATGFYLFWWWAVGDLNSGLPPCEDGTLTAELTAH